jgi:hypothetical protein
MKRILYIFCLFTLSLTARAQDDDAGNGGRIRERMSQYIQKNLALNEGESARFAPVFLSYFNELRQINQTYRGDRLVLQQKIVDLRIRYRDQFKPIMGEKRSNEVFTHEREFVDKVKQEIMERKENRIESRSNKKTGLLQ